MANLPGLLGTMLATRMAGRGRMGGPLGGPDLLGGLAGGLGGRGHMGGMGGLGGRRARGGSGSLARTAGLATLGYLAYRSLNQTQNRGAAAGRDGASSGAQGGLGGLLGALTGDGGQTGRGGRAAHGDRSLGDRLGDALGSDRREEMPEGAELSDSRALLLIRAMITAANADGIISREERERILGKLDEAGADQEDRRFIERELDDPKPLDDLLREVRDPETAQQFYLASRAATGGDTRTDKSYLAFLRDRLQLNEADAEELEQLA